MVTSPTPEPGRPSTAPPVDGSVPGATPRTGSELGAVVLTGGRARRLEGADKAALELAGVSLLEHALAALVDVPDVVVVGEPVATSRPVRFAREEPVGSGPAAGLLAGIRAFEAPPRLLVVLAVDMPMVSSATVSRLLLSSAEHGALLVDEDGRRQQLCAVYDSAALLADAPGRDEAAGASVRSLVDGLRLAEVPAMPWEARDVDTWEDLAVLRERLGDPAGSGPDGGAVGPTTPA